MILAIIFAIIAVALLCNLTFHLIIFALPLYVGATLGIALHSGGAGLLASTAAGIVAGTATLVIAHWLLALVKSPVAHCLIGLAFALPAAFAAYHLVHWIVSTSTPSSIWAVLLSVTGALIFGIFAWMRVLCLSSTPAKA